MSSDWFGWPGRPEGRVGRTATVAGKNSNRYVARKGILGGNFMSPDEGLARQIEMYRNMTGEQRLKIALDLHEFACNISRDRIRRQFPDASDEEVERHLRRRIELTRQ